MNKKKIRIEEISDRLSDVLKYCKIKNFKVKSTNNWYKIKISEKLKDDFINISIYLTMETINRVKKNAINKIELEKFIKENNLKKYQSTLINKKKLIQKIKKERNRVKEKEKKKLFNNNHLNKNYQNKNRNSFVIKFNNLNFGKNLKNFINKIGIGIEIIIYEEKKEIYFCNIDYKH